MKTSSSANQTSISESLMESFLQSTSSATGSAREQWLAQQAMLSLMRLVRSEQLLDIRRSVKHLLPEAPLAEPVKRTKSRRGSRKQPGQTQLAFGREG